MARRVYIPANNKNKQVPAESSAEDQQKTKPKKQTAAVRAAALAMIKRTRKSIDPKILEVARKALPEHEDDVNKLFFGDKNLIEEEIVPIDRKKNLETLFSFLESDKISDALRQKIASAMKEAALQ
jgi:hypothetical protein